jgi:hypothetical protein
LRLIIWKGIYSIIIEIKKVAEKTSDFKSLLIQVSFFGYGVTDTIFAATFNTIFIITSDKKANILKEYIRPAEKIGKFLKVYIESHKNNSHSLFKMVLQNLKLYGSYIGSLSGENSYLALCEPTENSLFHSWCNFMQNHRMNFFDVSFSIFDVVNSRDEQKFFNMRGDSRLLHLILNNGLISVLEPIIKCRKSMSFSHMSTVIHSKSMKNKKSNYKAKPFNLAVNTKILSNNYCTSECKTKNNLLQSNFSIKIENKHPIHHENLCRSFYFDKAWFQERHHNAIISAILIIEKEK